MVTGYCDIYDVHDGINSEEGETIRKSGECDVTEVKKKEKRSSMLNSEKSSSKVTTKFRNTEIICNFT